MKLTIRLCLAALLLLSTTARAQLDLVLKPDNDQLRQNIEVHIGDLEGRNTRGLRQTTSYVREQARQALQALGYYNPSINLTVLEEGPRLRLEIDAGEPVRFQDVLVRIEGPGSDFAAFQLPPDRIPKRGQKLDHSRYEGLKGLIRDRAQVYGFFDGKFSEQVLRVNPNTNAADVRLVYQTGRRFELGDVTFTGDTVFSDDLLNRFVQFEPGTPYQSNLIANLNRDLRGSGYFDEILIDATPARADNGRIPVTVQLGERKRHSVGVGGGFSTDVGPRALLNWTQHWINESGHKRGAEAEVSGPRQTLGGWYEIPLDPPMTDSLRFTTGYQREDIDDVETRQLSLGTEWHHRTNGGWQRVVSLEWQDERYEIGDDSGHSRLLLPGLSLDKLVSDDSIDPSEGYRLQLASQAGHRAVLSTVDVARIVLAAKGLTTVAENHRFLLRASVGAVATNDFENVPPTLRFFAGGDQSVRGYGYRSLGPTNSDGDNLGGRYLLESGAEYQYEFRENWRVASFIDHGNAVDTLNDALKTGAGMGIRWVSPVGPLRLDIARALTDQHWRIHFSMGPEL
ncbi:autotransporter assembly complex protein TamA [Hydrocarboniclastica marina]|uniref:Translocation and assembly module subunit TamA n=1 Tax=Hydrocarboniclastica marina TaxID=2259620 RepID=A0A4V1D8C0_9ALTE|nr:autotransporter assembly complex family protein [Hydrocarboniclastica marina]MAL98775.1 hypothetical protein [Alteromonadaceae bacterium]QCF24660.1 outer membrane protein assembly factor [Hydrocarboniclastica marina]